jgi:hypothetical protein
MPYHLDTINQLHKDYMSVLWGPVINLSIILGIYTYRRYAVIAHSIISGFVGIFSMIISFYIPAKKGFVESTNHYYTH